MPPFSATRSVQNVSHHNFKSKNCSENHYMGSVFYFSLWGSFFFQLHNKKLTRNLNFEIRTSRSEGINNSSHYLVSESLSRGAENIVQALCVQACVLKKENRWINSEMSSPLLCHCFNSEVKWFPRNLSLDWVSYNSVTYLPKIWFTIRLAV